MADAYEPARQPKRGLTYLLTDTIRLIAVLVALATASGYLAGVHRLFELACHFRFQYLAASAVCLLALLLLRDGRWSVVAAGAVVLNGAEVLPWYLPERPSSQAAGASFRVVLSNVLTSNPGFGQVLALAREEAPDLLVLQEIDPRWSDEMAELDQELPYSKKLPRLDNFGIGLWSRYPLVDIREIESGTYGVPSIAAHVEVNGETIAVLATHPLPPASLDGFRQRNAQLSDLATIARESKFPFVLVGDLNVTMWSPYYRKLIHDSGLRNARKGFGIIPTWPSDLPIMYIPLDHCLVSPVLQVKGFRRGRDVGSDHYPVVVDLVLPGAAAAPK